MMHRRVCSQTSVPYAHTHCYRGSQALLCIHACAHRYASGSSLNSCTWLTMRTRSSGSFTVLIWACMPNRSYGRACSHLEVAWNQVNSPASRMQVGR